MKTQDIRKKFLHFFEKHGHKVLPSASLLPEDPTLLFTTAGMVPFKDYFTRKKEPPFPTAATSQKCVRAGGKHNDLEQVGYTKRHHTFFEMLGNFSFGDYFKRDAIFYAWTFLTKELLLPEEKLSVTVFHTDDEARMLWKEIAGLPDERIYSIDTDDNFWSMGNTGPCGPCTEIFYDHGEDVFGGPPGSAHADGDRFVEIWNIVFMSYEKIQKGDDIETIPLLNSSIDTGMGLERLATILQGVKDNFETDILKALVLKCEELSGISSRGEKKFSHRVIADHIRSICFLMADGLLPSHEGRGYVLRRIIRRALRHAQHLSCGVSLLIDIIPTLVREMQDPYRELLSYESAIKNTLLQEGEKFSHLLQKGLVFLDGWKKEKDPTSHVFPGEKAFHLYDTFGFPLDLIQDIMKEDGIQVDEGVFHQCMEAQKARSKDSWVGSGEKSLEDIWISLEKNHSPTEFVGYDKTQDTSSVCVILKGNGNDSAQSISAGEKGKIITISTPFYGESGGQVGDKGIARTKTGTFLISDTQKKGVFVVHDGHVESGSIGVGEAIDLSVDTVHRRLTAANHSATHLLHEALRQVLGNHVVQRGSLVSSEKLRFDFNHFQALTVEEIEKVERLVNGHIQANLPIDKKVMKKEEAFSLGAMALFGEKYEDNVRVICMGEAPEEKAEKKAFSIEFCGGTHASRTGDIGVFKIIAEGSVSSGVRRVEAVTGEGAVEFFQKLFYEGKSVAEKLHCGLFDICKALDERAEKTLKKKGVSPSSFLWTREDMGDNTFCFTHTQEDVSVDELREAVDKERGAIKKGLVLITFLQKGSLSFVLCMVGREKDNASLMIKEMIASLGEGNGGGRKDFAQGGGINPVRLSDIRTFFRQWLIQGGTLS